MKLMMENGEKFEALDISDWNDCGNHRDLLNANKTLICKGGYSIPATAKIVDSQIGENVSIGNNVEITNSVISNSVINDNTVIKNCKLDGCYIGENQVLENIDEKDLFI